MVNDASFMAHFCLMAKKGVWKCGSVSPMAKFQANWRPPCLVHEPCTNAVFGSDSRQHFLTIAWFCFASWFHFSSFYFCRAILETGLRLPSSTGWRDAVWRTISGVTGHCILAGKLPKVATFFQTATMVLV